MTTPPRIDALDELGRRFDVALATRKNRRLAGRPQTVAITLASVVLLADRNDPVTTARRLRALGLDVRFKLIVDNSATRTDPLALPTGSKDVTEPPAGTIVLLVLNADGGTGRTGMRTVLLELAPKDSEIARSHPNREFGR